MKQLFILLALLVICGCSKPAGQELVGKWKAEANISQAEIDSSESTISAEDLEAMAESFTPPFELHSDGTYTMEMFGTEFSDTWTFEDGILALASSGFTGSSSGSFADIEVEGNKKPTSYIL